jgi:hypothetical protein
MFKGHTRAFLKAITVWGFRFGEKWDECRGEYLAGLKEEKERRKRVLAKLGNFEDGSRGWLSAYNRRRYYGRLGRGFDNNSPLAPVVEAEDERLGSA